MNENDESIKVIGRALVTFGERLLLVSDDNKSWVLPGGELLPGQEMTEVIESAVKKETGLLVKAGRLFTVHEKITKDIHQVEFLFLCRFKDEEPDESLPAKKHMGYFSIDDINKNKNVKPGYLSFGQWTSGKRNNSRAIYQGVLDED